jgi:ADP-ribose pyrophosphatase YjhB (NUDIX family)
MDWKFQLPAWHIEWEETVKETTIRELKEEVNIDVRNEDLKVVHISHRVCKDRIYIDFYVEVLKYSWILKNNEVEKCSEIRFFDINNLSECSFVMFDIESIKKSNSWEFFSEIKM